ncbi:uncharacterized protein FOMMEDRAFT_160601 [Fomitiporia mediterranea MF3/22]|uniref:uncharacterized protein n=1 Tax=Fomitiporia mediterranea (strain MF3/22) TaxID=694068 RepID=UPI00044079AE|nr:uncharacterized protein FOMMEDRAFT_160601 [Fomitiporia mediterranea MF3/22]EJC99535.1 hypothetical protein FOMMEDRAFT_160601 [Fomitiporia mediterranea MF3/22]
MPLIENTSVCDYTISNNTLRLAIIDWTIPMVYGFALMLLALYKAAEYWKMSTRFRGFKLVEILIRDQIIYFLLAIMCCIFNLLYPKLDVENVILASILGQVGNPSFLCILGSRLLFNLKEAGKLGVNEGTNYRTKSMSNIKFEQPAAYEGTFTSNVKVATEDSGSTAFVPQDSSV